MNGEVLFLAHRMPWPPDRGDRIRSWHILNALAAKRRVHVVAPIDSEADHAAVGRVAAVATSVATAVRPAGKVSAMARALASGTPASVEAFAMPELHAAVRAVLAREAIGAIYAYSGQMAQYVPVDWDGRFVMDFVDMDSAKFAALGGFANGQEARRLLAWEIAAARRANVALFVSEAEAAMFRTASGLCNVAVVENGIDAGYFDPELITEENGELGIDGPLIVFTGQMDYAPNVAAVTAFVREVLPRLEARFAIVGRAPTAAVRALVGEKVIVTGEVPDTRPWLAAAHIVVAPLALARGVQNKVLEAMAMARPVVLSSAAATGIDAEDGVHFVVADGAEAMVEAIAALFDDPKRAAAIGRAARTRMMARYDWASTLESLDGLLFSVASAEAGVDPVRSW